MPTPVEEALSQVLIDLPRMIVTNPEEVINPCAGRVMGNITSLTDDNTPITDSEMEQLHTVVKLIASQILDTSTVRYYSQVDILINSCINKLNHIRGDENRETKLPIKLDAELYRLYAHLKIAQSFDTYSMVIEKYYSGRNILTSDQNSGLIDTIDEDLNKFFKEYYLKRFSVYNTQSILSNSWHGVFRESPGRPYTECYALYSKFISFIEAHLSIGNEEYPSQYIFTDNQDSLDGILYDQLCALLYRLNSDHRNTHDEEEKGFVKDRFKKSYKLILKLVTIDTALNKFQQAKYRMRDVINQVQNRQVERQPNHLIFDPDIGHQAKLDALVEQNVKPIELAAALNFTEYRDLMNNWRLRCNVHLTNQHREEFQPVANYPYVDYPDTNDNNAITESLTTIYCKIAMDIENFLGPAPCKFALMGHGSFSM